MSTQERKLIPYGVTSYAEMEEYPEAQISQFVIYCFGNQGFRVFSVE